MTTSGKFEGQAENAAGKVEEAAGAITGDAEMEAQGKARQAFGQAQSALCETCDTVKGFTADKPFMALGIAAGIGFLFGRLAARR